MATGLASACIATARGTVACFGDDDEVLAAAPRVNQRLAALLPQTDAARVEQGAGKAVQVAVGAGFVCAVLANDGIGLASIGMVCEGRGLRAAAAAAVPADHDTVAIDGGYGDPETVSRLDRPATLLDYTSTLETATE